MGPGRDDSRRSSSLVIPYSLTVLLSLSRSILPLYTICCSWGCTRQAAAILPRTISSVSVPSSSIEAASPPICHLTWISMTRHLAGSTHSGTGGEGLRPPQR